MPSVAEKRREFRRLHERGCFVLPNPWDIGSARYLQGQGFKAIASTSAGFAFTQGLPDGAVSREMMLAHLSELSDVADIPVNADFEGGFADDPDGVAESVRLCCATGVSGLSIEDSTGNPDNPLYDFDLSLARVKAARAAIDKAGPDVRVHRAQRRLHPQPSRSCRNDPAAQGLCRSGRGLPLCTRHQDAGGNRGGRCRGRAEAGQFPDGVGDAFQSSPISKSSACAGSALAARWRASPGRR